MNKQSHAIVIGSGVAGLAAAIRLSVAGFRVSVYEANGYPGGKLSYFEKDGFRFDAGPSLFTQPENIEALFQLAGESIQDHFEYQQTDVVCHYFFENGKRLKTYADKEKLASEFQEVLGEDREAVLKYMDRAGKLYNHVGRIFLNHSLHDLKTWLHPRILKALKTVRMPYLFGSLHQYNQSCFRSYEAVQLFNRFATYNGSDPYKAPGMLSMIPHLEQNQGTFYPKGGMISITNALFRLAEKKGVQFYFNHPVQAILRDGNKVKGVLVDDKPIESDQVISNADVYFTYSHLLKDAKKAKKIERIERSSSALIFYWGVNRTFKELGLHNIFFSKDYRQEFSCLFDKKMMFEDPTVYINITSKMEAGQAPEGCENWFVMVNAPEHNGEDWTKLADKIRASIMQKISRLLGTDIEPHIVHETVMDPVGISQKTGTYKGSLYGTSSNSKLAAFFRPANFSSVSGLYFCGGTVHPGGGIPLCLKSAEITVDMIQKKHGRQ